MVVKCNYPQNTDLVRHYLKKEKKPFPVPIVGQRHAARERIKKSKGKSDPNFASKKLNACQEPDTSCIPGNECQSHTNQ
jgi:APO RNA-binding